MANRSYLYSLSNRPASFEDRPESLTGLSEWPYDVPFLHRLLLSGEPERCASLISDGLDDDEPGNKTPLYAISSRFEPGFKRIKRFVEIVKCMPAPAFASALPKRKAEVPLSFFERVKQRLAPRAPASAPVPGSASDPSVPGTAQLHAGLDETIAFVEQHRNIYLLLETVELDLMQAEGAEALQTLVDEEVARCGGLGAQLDLLPADPAEAARVLQCAAAERSPSPLDVFYGLRFDDACDSTCIGATERPLGLYWTDSLYFALDDKASFKAPPGQG